MAGQLDPVVTHTGIDQLVQHFPRLPMHSEQLFAGRYGAHPPSMHTSVAAHGWKQSPQLFESCWMSKHDSLPAIVLGHALWPEGHADV